MHSYYIKYICNIIILVIQFKSLTKNKNDWLILIFKPSFHENNNIIEGNEKADKAARETVNNPMTEIRTYSSLIDIHS